MNLTHAHVDKVYLDVNTIEFEAQWYDTYDDTDALTIYIALYDVNKSSYINDTSLIEFIEIIYESDDTSVYLADASAELKVYTSEYTVSNPCNYECYSCITEVDIEENQDQVSIALGESSTNTNCTCPSGSNDTFDMSITKLDTMNVTMTDGSGFYFFVEELMIGNESFLSVSASVHSWMDNSYCNISTSYYVNKGTFLGVEAANTLYLSFNMTVDHVLNDTEISYYKALFKTFFSDVFKLEESEVTCLITFIKTITVVDDNSEGSTTRRMLLQDDSETTYQVDIIILTDSADDASVLEAESYNITTDAIADWLYNNSNGTVEAYVEDVSVATITESEADSIGGAASTAGDSNDSDTLPAWLIILIILLCICCFCCVLFCLYWYDTRVKKRTFDASVEKNMLDEDYGAYLTDTEMTERIDGRPVTKNVSMVLLGDMSPRGSDNEEIEIVGHTAGMPTDEAPSPPIGAVTTDGDHVIGESLLLVGDDLFAGNAKPKAKGRHRSQFSEILVETKDLLVPLQSYVGKMHNPSMGGNVLGGAVISEDGNFTTVASETTSLTGGSDVNSLTNSETMVNSVTALNKALEIKYDDLEFGKQLGKGQFGSVFKAVWIEESVAVKQLNNDLESVMTDLYPNDTEGQLQEKWHVYANATANETMRSTTSTSGKGAAYFDTLYGSLASSNDDPTSAGGSAQYAGIARGSVAELGNKAKEMDRKVKELYSEIVLACSIPYHPNLVRVIGFVPNPLCIVMDYMSGGSVEEFCYVNEDLSMNKRKPALRELLIILSKAANGIKFLQKYGLVHRDVAARNVLLGRLNKSKRVDKSTDVKVTDFGMTRSLEGTNNSNGGKTKSNFGPVKWMAPESIERHAYSDKTDVYMFGITMWEVYYGMEPYGKTDIVNVAFEVVKSGLRPNIGLDVPRGFADLMQACWQVNPASRPSFEQVHQLLRKLTDKTHV